MAKQTLMDITEDHQALYDLIAEAEGDISGCEEAVDEWLAQLGEDADRKLNGYLKIIKEFEARAEARKVEAGNLHQMASADANRAAFLKGRVKAFFEAAGIDKKELPAGRISVVGNSSRGININVPPDKLPEQYRRVIPEQIEADKKAIKAALESGIEIEGCELKPKGTHLRIK